MLQDFKTYVEQSPVELPVAAVKDMLRALRPDEPALPANVFPLSPSDVIAIDAMILAYVQYTGTDGRPTSLDVARMAADYHIAAGGRRPQRGQEYAGYERVIDVPMPGYPGQTMPSTPSREIIRRFLKTLRDETGARRTDLGLPRTRDTDPMFLK